MSESPKTAVSTGINGQLGQFMAKYLLDNKRSQEALAVIAKAQDLQHGLRADTALIALKVKAEEGLKLSKPDSAKAPRG